MISAATLITLLIIVQNYFADVAYSQDSFAMEMRRFCTPELQYRRKSIANESESRKKFCLDMNRGIVDKYLALCWTASISACYAHEGEAFNSCTAQKVEECNDTIIDVLLGMIGVTRSALRDRYQPEKSLKTMLEIAGIEVCLWTFNTALSDSFYRYIKDVLPREECDELEETFGHNCRNTDVCNREVIKNDSFKRYVCESTVIPYVCGQSCDKEKFIH